MFTASSSASQRARCTDPVLALTETLEARCLLSAATVEAPLEAMATGPAIQMEAAPPAAGKVASPRTAAVPNLANIKFSGPIVITKGGTYRGRWQSLDANVPAVRIRTSQPVIIQNSVIRSCSSCIDVYGVRGNVTVRNTYGYGLNPMQAGKYPGRFLDVDGFTNVTATNNYMENTSGIYIYSYQGNHTAKQTVKVLRNVAKNIDGRVADGLGGWVNGAPNPDYYRQFFQINGVQGLVGAEIAWNQITNNPGESRVEENINIHATTGTAKSPVLVHDNYIQGAYAENAIDAANYTGGGIMLSDNGSSYIRAYNNQIVNTGHIGITITSGHDNAFYNNRIISCGRGPDGAMLSYSNIGAVVWNFNQETGFVNNGGYNNLIGWIAANGDRNDIWMPDAQGKTNNQAWPDPLTQAVEAGEMTRWKRKLASARVRIGPA